MKYGIALFTLILMFLTAPAAFSQTAPTQPQDPTAQEPTSASPAPPATNSAPKAQSPGTATSTGLVPYSRSAKARQFTGTILKESDGYVLKAGSLAYRLDDQDKAQEFSGRNVKVLGSLDKQSNTIHLESIEASPAL